MQVLKETEFTCSAGIAHNKVKSSLGVFVTMSQISDSFSPQDTSLMFVMVINLCLMFFSDAGQTC